MNETIVIGCDHGGYKTKQAVIKELAKNEYFIVDIGGFSDDVNGVAQGKKDDYPDYAKQVATAVASDRTGMTKGILICGSGTGMVIAANKVKGVRAALAYDAYSAKMARYDNDANVLTLRGRLFPARTAARLARIFLTTEFSGFDRHKRRIRKIAAMERR